MDERSADRAPTSTRQLTSRQREVLALIARGYTNGEIATELGITLDGAKFHVGEILERLNAPSRQAAAEFWRAEHSAAGHVRVLAGVVFGARALIAMGLVAIVAVAGVAAFAVANSGSGSSPATAPPVQDIVNAVRQPGMVFYTEATMTQIGRGGSSPGIVRSWYSADEAAARTASGPDAVANITIFKDDRQATFDIESNEFHETPPQSRPPGVPDGAISYVTHIGLFFSGDDCQFVGKEKHEGRPVVRFESTRIVTRADQNEMQDGTVFSYTILLGADDLLPVAVHSTLFSPEGEKLMQTNLDYTTVEFEERSAIAADFFDVNTLAGQKTTIEEALAIGAKQHFATFWRGPSLDVSWTN